MLCYCLVFFFFKQKTAYEMRISDWSSDVCSSDLIRIMAGFRSEQVQLIARVLVEQADIERLLRHAWGERRDHPGLDARAGTDRLDAGDEGLLALLCRLAGERLARGDGGAVMSRPPRRGRPAGSRQPWRRGSRRGRWRGCPRAGPRATTRCSPRGAGWGYCRGWRSRTSTKRGGEGAR